ncbi:hypothetical protein N431DRAFT_510673 [Stipitochalara longipes BDJ]|nr:hypothetical protein N431DRAFT_510673 [Stipitochalara longipes BDJ]
MEDPDDAQLALHPHGFSTGTENRPGRLVLRDVLPQEVAQLKHILIAPENSKHDGANPEWVNSTDWDVHVKLGKHLRTMNCAVHLFIILKPKLDIHMKLIFDRTKFMIKDSHVIGYLTIDLKQNPQDPNDPVAYIGIVIHHEVAQHKFGKEAFISVLDYILLGQPTKMSNGNLCGLGMSKAFVETGMKNDGLPGLMGSLHLKHLAREGTPDHGQKKNMKVPSITYTITKADWLEARKHVTMEWMPAGQQTLSGDGSPNLSELKPEYNPGSSHASGSGAGYAAGTGASSIH